MVKTKYHCEICSYPFEDLVEARQHERILINGIDFIPGQIFYFDGDPKQALSPVQPIFPLKIALILEQMRFDNTHLSIPKVSTYELDLSRRELRAYSVSNFYSSDSVARNFLRKLSEFEEKDYNKLVETLTNTRVFDRGLYEELQERQSNDNNMVFQRGIFTKLTPEKGRRIALERFGVLQE